MDSRETPPPSHPLRPPPVMLTIRPSNTRSPNPNPNLNPASSMVPGVPTSTSLTAYRPVPFGFFGSPHQHQEHQAPRQLQHQAPCQLQQQPMYQKTLDSLRSGDGTPSQSIRLGAKPQQMWKKRGRPRLYRDDIPVGLATTNRGRGRPAGPKRKQLDALGGTRGVGFTPHVIEVNAGEDIASKLRSFSEEGPRTICILSGTGSVGRVTLRHGSSPSGITTFEGRYEIVTLSGCFGNCEGNGTNRMGSINVSLGGSDGKILGGGVIGVLEAASPVQVVVGSFVPEAPKRRKKSKEQRGLNPEPTLDPTASARSQGTSSDSFGEDESSSSRSMQQGSNSGTYGSAAQEQEQEQQQPQPQQQQQQPQQQPQQQEQGQEQQQQQQQKQQKQRQQQLQLQVQRHRQQQQQRHEQRLREEALQVQQRLQMYNLWRGHG